MKFNQFDTIIDDETLVIVGITDSGQEKQLLKLHFKSDNLLLHTYFALLDTLHSGLRIKTLNDLLKKSLWDMSF